jgi:hypothetical protein
MNSEGLRGIRIEWQIPSNQRDYSNLKDTDFVVLNYNAICPRVDGLPIDFSGAPNAENLEWLMYAEGERLTDYDFRIFIENQSQRPTNEKDTEFVNYNKFLTTYSVTKRPIADIIAAIRQLENEANLAIQNEGEKAKMAMLIPAVTTKLASGTTLNAAETAVYNRMLEVAEKAFQNAANADLLIELAKVGANLDLDSGWIYDNITPQGYPFSM